MSHLLDREGNVYQQGTFGEWERRQGLLGPGKGRPERDWLGRPEQARDESGHPVTTRSGDPLYIPARPPGPRGQSGAEDIVAAFAGLMLVVGIVATLGLILAAIGQTIAGTASGYARATRRYPRATLFFHLLLGMAVSVLGVRAAGLPRDVQLLALALVPGLWVWYRLTLRLPLVFMPVNAVGAAAGSWVLANATREHWQTIWQGWTEGIPFVQDLALVLAALPPILLFWVAGARRWPKVFRPLNLLALGALFWFLLTRVWTAWLPVWAEWSAPIPLMPPAGAILLFAPLLLWLWIRGQERWPLPLTFVNLLLFGAVLGVTAYHSEASWLPTWSAWTEGLPLAAAPLAVIGLGPASLWLWTEASRRWVRLLHAPNLLLSGAVLWLLVDRTRPIWNDGWYDVLGQTPLQVDLAPLTFLAPLALWLWERGADRWPVQWGLARTAVLGGVLWWLAERSRSVWETAWQASTGGQAIDPALLLGAGPPVVWVWWHMAQRWPRAGRVVAWVAGVAALWWLVGLVLPDSTLGFRLTVAAIPVAAAAWLWLARRLPLLGALLFALPFLVLLILTLVAPDALQTLLDRALSALLWQGLPVDRWLYR